jgi:hypothetical protein
MCGAITCVAVCRFCNAGQQAFFPCGNWLGGAGAALLPGVVGPLTPATCMSPAALPAVSTDPRKQLAEYQV